MSELTDDQLDGLFRKSAEEFEPPYDPAAWPTMNARLDASDRTPPDGRALLMKKLLRWGLPIVLLLLLFVGGWYSTDRAGSGGTSVSQTPVTIAKVEPEQALGNETAQGSVARLANTKTGEPILESGQLETIGEERETPRFPQKGGFTRRKQVSISEPAGVGRGVTENHIEKLTMLRPDGSNTDRPDTEVVSPGTTVNRPAGTQKRTTKSRLVTSSGSGIDNIIPELLPNRSDVKHNRTPIRQASKTGADRKGRASSVADHASNNTSLIAQQDKVINDKSGQEQIATGENDASGSEPDISVAVTLPALTELAIRPAVWSRPAPLTDYPVTAPATESTAQRITSAPVTSMRGLSVRFVIAPDLSAVGLKNFARPGTNVGLLLEYRLAKRWSVQAGVMQSTKVYKAATSDYAMPDYTTKWPVQPLGVDGRCNMIDIPLNLRYDALMKPRQNGQAPSRWFISGGVTSYVMRQEDYVYQYENPADPRIYPKNRGWNGASGAYGFSELNLSAGYERAISRRFSWQVEPYLKVPLRGVGYYKINLLSTGGFFSLRYKF